VLRGLQGSSIGDIAHFSQYIFVSDQNGNSIGGNTSFHHRECLAQPGKTREENSVALEGGWGYRKMDVARNMFGLTVTI
jgi:hypothetical protein